jgi:cytochrome P450
MTTDTVRDTDLPTIEYEHAQSPEEAHELIRQARVQGPIALGPHGPEVLTPAMLTFGGGIHYCLGAHLARIELAEALTTMAQRMPNMRITGPVPWKSITGISGPSSLPVAFGRA